MTHHQKPRICVVPMTRGVGGMVSFRHKLSAGLSAQGIEVTHDLSDTPYRSVLVIGGTRHLGKLWRIRRQGIPVVQRLDGMNWLHRVPGSPRLFSTGFRHFLRAEYGNAVLSFIRSRLATHVVYQSEFVHGWWERIHGLTVTPFSVIYNGVDLSVYTPNGKHHRPDDRYRLLLVEGSLMGGYELGLQSAIRLTENLNELIKQQSDLLPLPVELAVAGRVPEAARQRWEQSTQIMLKWIGLVERECIPELDRSAHLLFSADINAACPNSVIEAMACGLPVVGFATGALPELVRKNAGCLSPYGGDPWRLETPDTLSLAKAALEILSKQEHFRRAARVWAEAEFGLDKMVERYLEVLMGT
ncbi:MAG: glycosyltransferase family 4 protein [Anaerolineales bacterium]|nr:glycosyltransferase family 4 protein [Anaerolineales bacterium]